MTIITDLQYLDVQLGGLHQRTPYAYTDVSKTQLSIARHYGAIILQGESYTYFPEADELVRDDVLPYIRSLPANGATFP